MDRFEITIQRASAGNAPVSVEWARADGSPAVHAEGELLLDQEALNAEGNVRAYGEILGRATFDGDIGIAFARAEAAADDRLHVLLEVEDDTLKGLRWQRLCAHLDGSWRHLMLVRRTPFSLYVPSPIDRRFVPFGRSELRTLIVAASPPGILEAFGLEPFDVQAAVTAVKGSLGEGMACHVLADIPGADGPPTLAAVTSAISSGRFPLIHFICHGAVREDTEFSPPKRLSFLYLADAKGRTDQVDGDRLVESFANLKGPYGLPHFAFLAACEMAGPTANGAYGGLAEQFVRDLGMPAVLAMTEPISTDTANSLATEFYKGVRDHGEIDRALVEACAGLAESGDVTVPAIFSRLGTRSLFALVDREPTSEEVEEGLVFLDDLFRERAPVLREKLEAATSVLRRTLGIPPGNLTDAAREGQENARREIDALCNEVIECSFASLAIEKKAPAYEMRCPFRGLEPFREGDQDVFFGREREIERLKQRLREHPFLAVIGRSGSGKSSLVLAGLLPALRKENPALESAVCEPDSEPLANLERAVSGLGAGALIVVDQFEEVFTHGASEAERVAFFARLLSLGASHPIVITIRDDFLADCAPYDRLREAVQKQEIIAPMSLEDLRGASGRQAASVGLDFEAGLADAILSELRDEPSAMPLLQYTLLRLWERRHGRWLRALEYEAIGRVQGALAQRAEEVYCGLDSEPDCERLTERRSRARQIFVRLTRLDDARGDDAQPRDTRQRVLLGELVPADEAPAATEEIVEQLVAARLLVMSTRQRPGQTSKANTTGEGDGANPAFAREELVELGHEALIRRWPRLQRWLEEDRDNWRLQQEIGAAARKWRQGADAPGYLLRDPELTAAEALLAQPQIQLNSDERDFVVQSVALRAREAAERQAEEDRRRQLTTRIAWISTISALVFLASLIVARFLWVRAEEQTKIAQTQTTIAEEQTEAARLALSRQLAIASDQLRDQEFSQSLLLSREAEAFGDTLTARGSMLNGLTSHPGLMTFLRGHHDEVTTVALAPDQTTVASGAQNGSVLISDLLSGQPIGLPLSGDQGRIRTIAFNDDGLLVAYSDMAGQIQVWDRASAEEPLASFWDDRPPTAMAFSPDNTTLLTAGEDGWLRQWNVATGDRLWERALADEGEAVAADNDVTRITLSSDGRMLALGTTTGRIDLWDTADPEGASFVRSLARTDVGCTKESGPFDVAALAFGATGQVLTSAYADGCLAMVDLQEQDPAAVKSTDLGVRGITAVATAADGAVVVTRTGNGQMTIWRPTRSFDAGTTLLSVAEPVCADFGKAHPVDQLQSGEGGFATASHTGDETIALSADGRTLVAAGAGCAVAVWRLDGQTLLGRPVQGSAQDAGSVAFSADGELLAATGCVSKGGMAGTCGSESISVWHSADGSPAFAPLTAGDNRFTSVTFAPGSLLAAGGCATPGSEEPCRLGVIRLWDAAKGEAVGAPMLGHTSWVEALAIAADGTTLASAGADGTIIIWKEITTAPRRALEISGHPGGVTSIAFAPEGLLLASGGEDGVVRLWNLADADPEETVRVLSGHSEVITGVAFHPNEPVLASSSRDGAVILWSAESGQRLLRPLVVGTAPQLDVAFNRDGTTLATIDASSEVALWDFQTRQELGTGLRALWRESTIAAVAFSPTADLLASGGGGEPATLWDMDPDVWAERACTLAARNLVWVEWNHYLAEFPYPEQPRCPGEAVFTERLRMADSYALAGQVDQAKRLFTQVVEMVSATRDASLNGDVCWTGSFSHFDDLAMPACDRAIELEPGNAEFYDARGVARALAGDTAGAIEDFTFYIRWVEEDVPAEDSFLQNKRAQREAWVSALRSGDNPFTPGTLEALRNEVDRRHVGLG